MNDYWFGEWVQYDSVGEKIDAEQYLWLWRKFMLKKLKDLVYVDEQWIEKNKNILGIKVQMKGIFLQKNPYDNHFEDQPIMPIPLGES